MSTWTTVVATPSGVTFDVRVEPPDGSTTSHLAPRWWGEVADAIDSFAYTRCETCGYDLEDHVVVPGPFGKPFIHCEKGTEN